MPSFNPDPFKPGEVPSRIGAERAAITMRSRAVHSEEDANTHSWTAVHVLEAYARGDLVIKPKKAKK